MWNAGLFELLRRLELRELDELGVVVVHRARNDVEVEPLGAPRALVHVPGEALGIGVVEPLLDGEPVALRLRDLLALLVQEELVGERLGRTAAEDAADRARERHRLHQVLARHLVVDVERVPAQRPVDLPLALDPAAGDLDGLALALAVLEGDGAGRDVVREHRHLQHDPGLGIDRQERRVGPPPLLAQRRQHHVADAVMVTQHLEQCSVEPSAAIAVGGRQELVLEPEPVEERAQPRVVVLAEARVGAERVGHRR